MFDGAAASLPSRRFFSKVSSERGKEGEGRTWVALAQIKIKFKYPKISKNIFLERQTICGGKWRMFWNNILESFICFEMEFSELIN